MRNYKAYNRQPLNFHKPRVRMRVRSPQLIHSAGSVFLTKYCKTLACPRFSRCKRQYIHTFFSSLTAGWHFSQSSKHTPPLHRVLNLSPSGSCCSLKRYLSTICGQCILLSHSTQFAGIKWLSTQLLYQGKESVSCWVDTLSTYRL